MFHYPDDARLHSGRMNAYTSWLIVAVACSLLTGCYSPPPPAPIEAAKATAPSRPPQANGATSAIEQPAPETLSTPSAPSPESSAEASKPATPAEQPTAQPAVQTPATDAEWDALLAKTQEQLGRDALADARQSIAELNSMSVERTPQRTAQLQAVEAELTSRGQRLGEQQIQERLAQISRLIDSGKLDDAEQAAGEVLKANVSDAQRAEAAQWRTTIAARREAVHRLAGTVEALASQNREEVLGAQQKIFEESRAALPLLVAAVHDSNPTLVHNALEMLRLLKRPDMTLPALVDVLEREDQAANWPRVVHEIQLSSAPGAGAKLLELAVRSKNSQQRLAALETLAAVVDPPEQTLFALLPLLHRDGPELTSALAAASSAVAVHQQHDLVSLRGLDAELPAEQQQRLAMLPARLTQLMAGSGPDAVAARSLAVATRQLAAEPLSVKLLAYSGEVDGSPATAALDGMWNTVDVKQMWRHPAGRPPSLLLDLGGEKTVVAVRIWNLNEPGAMHRGWKEASVYVDSTPSTGGAVVAKGIVAPAPGVGTGTDYSVTVPVNFARGRFVRLQASGPWKADGHVGITEVQVLGF